MTLECIASHYSGCGNDFLLFDNRKKELSQLTAKMVKSLCAVRGGAGVDGIILVSPSKNGDAAMNIFNRDGSEAEMCGNGVRCLMQYLRQKLSYPRQRCLLETMKRDILVSSDDTEVTVHIGKVHELGWDITLSYNKKPLHMHFLDSGVPHVVIFVDDVDVIDVDAIGRYVRNHTHFAPNGTNVNFVSHVGNQARIRTYERGVEAETLACGTGVSASAYALHKIHGCSSPITFQVRSGELLTVLFEPRNTVIDTLALKGPARWIRDYDVTLDFELGKSKLHKGKLDKNKLGQARKEHAR